MARHKIFFYKRASDRQIVPHDFTFPDGLVEWEKADAGATLLVHAAHCTGWRTQMPCEVLFARNCDWDMVEILQGQERTAVPLPTNGE